MLQALARLFGATRPVVQPVATGFPVAPLVGPVARPGTDAAGFAIDLRLLESEGVIDSATFHDGFVVLPVYNWDGLAGLYAADQAVFARMLEVRGGLDAVLGAAVRVRDTGNGLELRFCMPRGSGNPTSAPRDRSTASSRARHEQADRSGILAGAVRAGGRIRPGVPARERL